MTFSYTPGTPDDITRLRSRVGDRTQVTETGVPATESGIRSDEEIQMWIDAEGSWQRACIVWVQSVLLEIDQEPDSTADWLEVDLASARVSYFNMLDELKEWLDVPNKSVQNRTATTVKLWRSDTLQSDPN